MNLFSGGETGPREPESLERASRCSVNEYLLQAKGKRQKAKQNVSLSASRCVLAKSHAMKLAVPVSADSHSPQSHTQAKRVLMSVPRGDLALGQPPIWEEGERSGGAINPPNHSWGGRWRE